MAVGALATLTLIPVGSAAADEEEAVPAEISEAVPIHHYSETSQGANTVIEYPSENGTAASFEVQPLASVSWVPFGWTINFDSTLRGRDMKSSTGVFCQRFKSRNNTNMKWIQITLVRHRPNWWDVNYDTKNFRATGVWSQRKCWAQHDSSATYHFDYNVRPGYNGQQVIGKGYASK